MSENNKIYYLFVKNKIKMSSETSFRVGFKFKINSQLRKFLRFF